MVLTRIWRPAKLPTSLHGRIGEVSEAGKRIGWLLVRQGGPDNSSDELQRFIQLLFYDVVRKDIFDDFQNDPVVCDEMERQLSSGVLDWYGRIYSVRWLNDKEAERVRDEIGWPRRTFP